MSVAKTKTLSCSAPLTFAKAKVGFESWMSNSVDLVLIIAFLFYSTRQWTCTIT